MAGADPLLKKLRISGVKAASAVAVTLTLEPLGWQPQYRAGQFITLVFQTPRGEKRRSYSISSSAALGEPLQITVKKIDNGEFSRPLYYHSRPGDVLLCTGISGVFTLPDDQGKSDFLFLAAGSGVTPCLPMIRELLAMSDRPVALIYSNRARDQAIFIDELLALQQEYPARFRLYTLFSDSNELRTRRLSKWLLDQLLDELVPRPADTLFYLCGPFEFMQMCRIALLVRAHKSQVRSESFDQSPRLLNPEPPDAGPHHVRVLIGGQTMDFTVRYPIPVTREAELRGIHLPYSCGAGRCGSCAATLTRGKMWMAYNEVLTDKEVAEGRVLACQAYPVGGDAELRFD
jgi:ring-1,2-phenylacetyl-CoA epoxidase subunit PaaE